MRRLCACGCGGSLDGFRADAKWATDACPRRWMRANPGRSKRDARAIVVGRAKAGRRSGVSIRIGARRAVDILAGVLIVEYGESPKAAYARVRLALRPLVNPRHRGLL